MDDMFRNYKYLLCKLFHKKHKSILKLFLIFWVILFLTGTVIINLNKKGSLEDNGSLFEQTINHFDVRKYWDDFEKTSYELKIISNFSNNLFNFKKQANFTNQMCNTYFNQLSTTREEKYSFVKKLDSYSLSRDQYMNISKNCDEFKKHRGYSFEPYSEEEALFPIAYYISVYKNIEQVERLFRSIYMPQNFYCFSIDAKADVTFITAIQSILKCFNNVFISNSSVKTFWGHISILQAELKCMAILRQFKWKYLINISGQMFPLKSNLELVAILNSFNGKNDIEGRSLSHQWPWERLRQIVRWVLTENGNMQFTFKLNSSPPNRMQLFKGTNQAAVSRDFVNYIFENENAKNLFDWLSHTYVPDEYFWPTLNHNPHLNVPGGYNGDPDNKTFTTRVSIWLPVSNQKQYSWSKWQCRGKWMRQICIFGSGDLPWLVNRPELFANKFDIDYDRIAFTCTEYALMRRTLSRKLSNVTVQFYKNIELGKYNQNDEVKI